MSDGPLFEVTRDEAGNKIVAMDVGTSVEVNARCRTCNLHIATMVCPAGADYEHAGYVASEVARHTADGREHDVAYMVESVAEALARREQEAVDRQAADALAHEQMLTRMRQRGRPGATDTGLIWPF